MSAFGCSECGRSFIKHDLDAVSIEPKRTPDRKWLCEDCLLPLSNEKKMEYRNLSRMFYNEKDPSNPLTYEEHIAIKEEEEKNGKTESKAKGN